MMKGFAKPSCNSFEQNYKNNLSTGLRLNLIFQFVFTSCNSCVWLKNFGSFAFFWRWNVRLGKCKCAEMCVRWRWICIGCLLWFFRLEWNLRSACRWLLITVRGFGVRALLELRTVNLAQNYGLEAKFANLHDCKA